ncbi:hypothetical protein BJ138DRAFT_1119880 [Hygrophoropsis aurantiaca]|uniref:Uncharacterized protein n=1 Tax=Hygrophoropsis aurantiaca TaxID=72124 RepID=A0ACB7ZSR0_9AGAM|nr:hypothetical protein BJ138DRAFT_1119880 [Hygrophoropsis aurantiaca]
MHAALLIQDIQYGIFDRISSKRTLNALSRTCKAFTESALDVKWRHVDSITTLIQCMPHDLWSRDRDYDLTDHYIFRLRRPILSSDWVVFQKYSSRVRTLKGPLPEKGSPVSIEESGALAFCSPSAPFPLLPNLKSLKWSIVSNAGILTLFHLISPNLTSLKVSMIPGAQLTPRFQSAISVPLDQIHPSLKQYATDGGQIYPQSLLEGLQLSVCQLQNLDTISWYNISNEAIVSLMQLPKLTRAKFETPEDFPSYIDTLQSQSPSQNHTFSGVRRLEVMYDGSLAPATALLKYFDFHLLENIHLSCHYPTQSTGMLEFLTALASSSSHPILEIIVDHRSRAFIPVSIRDPIGIHELRPLLQFGKLQRLVLEVQWSFVLNDATLLEMAGAWPHISTLYFNKNGHWDSGSQVTASAFLSLRERCPKLNKTSLPIDFSSVDSPDFDHLSINVSRDERRTASSGQFWFGPYRIVHPRAIACYLAAILPKAASISMLSVGWDNRDRQEYVESFKQTQEIYYNMRKVRRERNPDEDGALPMDGAWSS